MYLILFCGEVWKILKKTPDNQLAVHCPFTALPLFVTFFVYFPDIDECQSQGVCANGQCNNYAGGYECSCGPGFEPSSDMRYCVGKYIMRPLSVDYFCGGKGEDKE